MGFAEADRGFGYPCEQADESEIDGNAAEVVAVLGIEGHLGVGL